jgi:hypothetical protein
MKGKGAGYGPGEGGGGGGEFNRCKWPSIHTSDQGRKRSPQVGPLEETMHSVS